MRSPEQSAEGSRASLCVTCMVHVEGSAFVRPPECCAGLFNLIIYMSLPGAKSADYRALLVVLWPPHAQQATFANSQARGRHRPSSQQLSPVNHQSPNITEDDPNVTQCPDDVSHTSCTALECTPDTAGLNPNSKASEFLEAGKWHVLPNSRLGFALEPVISEVGLKQVFRAADFKSIMCRHGETARTIQHRLSAPTSISKVEVANGTGCDCRNSVLMRSGKVEVIPDTWAPPLSIFDLLCELGAEEIDFGKVSILKNP